MKLAYHCQGALQGDGETAIGHLHATGHLERLYESFDGVETTCFSRNDGRLPFEAEALRWYIVNKDKPRHDNYVQATYRNQFFRDCEASRAQTNDEKNQILYQKSKNRLVPSGNTTCTVASSMVSLTLSMRRRSRKRATSKSKVTPCRNSIMSPLDRYRAKNNLKKQQPMPKTTGAVATPPRGQTTRTPGCERHRSRGHGFWLLIVDGTLRHSASKNLVSFSIYLVMATHAQPAGPMPHGLVVAAFGHSLRFWWNACERMGNERGVRLVGNSVHVALP